MLVIVNNGIGNIGSIRNMLKKIGAEACVSSEPDEVARADRIILSGVGSFDSGMDFLIRSGLDAVLKRKALEEKVPFLGICLGMQVLSDKSEEGRRPGLGLIKGKTIRFSFSGEAAKLRIPHMGWNTVEPAGSCRLFDGIEGEKRFYFAHSYHVVPDDPSHVVGKTHYGFSFASAVCRENILGVQFHPEKSHRFGLALLKNFLEKY